jgi:primosomal protein N'
MASAVMENDEKQDEFRPRPYQEQLMNLVKAQNTIIYLLAGSGKTFIAVMLIKEMSASLDKGKHTFFMVNTVALVSQQAADIRRHSHHSVGEYSGDLNMGLMVQRAVAGGVVRPSDYGDDMSDIPEPSATWLPTVVGCKLAHI